MEIAVIGTGYVGLVTGACLSEVGNRVTCIDIDEEKVATLKQGISPIYEEGLEALLRKNISESRLDFTTDYKARVDAVTADKVKQILTSLNNASKVEYIIRK